MIFPRFHVILSVFLELLLFAGISCLSRPPDNVSLSAKADHPGPIQHAEKTEPSEAFSRDDTEESDNGLSEEPDIETILSSYSAGEKDAWQTLQEMEKIEKKNPEEKLMYAIMLRNTQRLDESRQELEAILESNPEDDLAMFNMALIEHAGGNEDARDRILNRVLEMDTRISEAYALKGKIETSRSNFLAAEKNFQQALRIEPDSVESLVGLAWLKARKGKPEEALSLLDNALKLDESYAYALSDRSRVNIVLGNYNDAEDDISRAIMLEPELSWHYLDRARIRLRYFRNLEGAKEDLNRVEELDPGNFFVQVYLAGLYDEQRNFERAEYYYRRVLAQHDNYPWAYMPMGKFAWMREDFARAVVFFDRALEEDGNQDIFLRLAAAFSRRQLGKDSRKESRVQLSALLQEYKPGSVQYEVVRFCIEGGSDFFAVNALNREKDDESLRERLWFYMGWMYKLENNLAGAQAVFERLASQTGFMEYDLAQVEAHRLQAENVRVRKRIVNGK